LLKKIRDKGKTDPGAKAYRTLGTPMLVSINNSGSGLSLLRIFGHLGYI